MLIVPASSPAKDVPQFLGAMTPAQLEALQQAKQHNRRITIEDSVTSVVKE